MYDESKIVRLSESSLIKQIKKNDLILYGENNFSYSERVTKSITTQLVDLYKVSTLLNKSFYITSDTKILCKEKGVDIDWNYKDILQVQSLLNKKRYREFNLNNCKGESFKQNNETLILYLNEKPLYLNSSTLADLPPYWIGHLLFNIILDSNGLLNLYLEDSYFYEFKDKYLGINQHKLNSLNREPSKIYSISSFQKVNNVDEIILELKNLGILPKIKCQQFIHKSYIYTSIENRVELLKGIIHAVGKQDLKKRVYIDVYSEQMSKDINLLVSTLGGWTYTVNYLGYYRVFLNLTDSFKYINYGLFSNNFIPLELPITNIEKIKLVESNKGIINRDNQGVFIHTEDDSLILLSETNI